MVSFGSKALPLRRPKHHSIVENSPFSGEDSEYKQGRRRRGMGRKSTKKQKNSNGGCASGSVPDRTLKDKKSSKKHDSAEPETSYVRKQIDPETAKYFSEIADTLEKGELDLEERSIICGNALEESSRKEVELCTDHIISHTMQALLDGCDADHLCGFLRGCTKNFARIATDRNGSHVAETAFYSLASHLLDQEWHSTIEDTLMEICQAIVQNPVDVMCNCYGSHVLRSLLCLCKGVPLNSEFHAAKSSSVLAHRLNLKGDGDHKNDAQNVHQGFPDVLEFLVSEMVKCSTPNIATLQVDQYGSLVLQTALKLLQGQDQELIQIIPVIMGCKMENAEAGNLIEITEAENIRDLVKENAFSHLMEVILEVAPDILYNEIFVKIFKDSLFGISCHHSANFAVQSLISHARSQSQIYVMSEELGPRFKDLLDMGRWGVVASLIAASQRLNAQEHECSRALVSAVTLANESPKCIVPRILLLESYFFSNDKSNWSWTSGSKVHVMGSLILQCLFKYPSGYIEPFITSLTSMESSHVLETAKDGAGARVIEAFLGSNASDKQKKKLIKKYTLHPHFYLPFLSLVSYAFPELLCSVTDRKVSTASQLLKGHFGELAMHPSGSFTVGKCFDASGVPLREAIVSDLLTVQRELSKTRHGPHLLRHLDVDGFSRQPEQWRSRQKSKLAVYKEFLAEFSSAEGDSSKRKNTPADTSKKPSQKTNIKKMRKEIDNVLMSFTASAEGSKKLKKHRIR
ncbi:hypothetical protein Cgig2_031153 [Carnegiea gigantea]|uniref:Uncharacterized protein n=1 Tax=Carnegiea gigantea TaxID=171969 RepID=A0A9Q1QPF2_9CARY|nr:hypothetical protein Cgig2_031153 [Carnegiea gigantea]